MTTTTDDELLKLAEAILANPSMIDRLKASPEVIAYIGAASPDRVKALVMRVKRAEEALRPFQQVGWPSVSDPDDQEGDIPDYTEVDVIASDFDMNATDYMVDPLTVGDFRRAAAYFSAPAGGGDLHDSFRKQTLSGLDVAAGDLLPPNPAGEGE